MWNLLFFLGALGLDSDDCSLITCENKVADKEYCMLYDPNEKTMYINNVECIGGCNFTSLYTNEHSWKSETCVAPNVTGHPTGHSCTVPSNCSSNICSVPYCYGVPAGRYCYNSEACMPNYYCLDNICVENKNPGDNCTIHEECPIGYGCDQGYCNQSEGGNCEGGVCQIFFSYPQGTATSDSKFCKSNFLYNFTCDSLLIYLKEYPEYELEYPFDCTIGQTCIYKSKVTGLEFDRKPCMCAGVRGKGGGYCSYYAEWADKIVKDHWIFLTYSDSNCSGNWTHTDEADILYRCNSITYDQYWYFHELRWRSRFLSLFESGAVNECSSIFSFFNVTFEPLTYAFGKILEVFSVIFLLFET